MPIKHFGKRGQRPPFQGFSLRIWGEVMSPDDPNYFEVIGKVVQYRHYADEDSVFPEWIARIRRGLITNNDSPLSLAGC
jgi:hypothetical protein